MTTLNLQVNADDNDVWQNASGVIAGTTTTPDASIGALTSGNFWAGFRFTGVTIPNGATINTATLQLFVLTGTNDDLVADFYFEAADNAAIFTTAASDVSGRSRTTAKASVSAAAIGATTWYSVTGLAAAMQEVISRPGFVNGNSVAVILDGLPGISFGCHDYNGGSTNAAKLDIDYTAAAGTSIPVITNLYRQRQ